MYTGAARVMISGCSTREFMLALESRKTQQFCRAVTRTTHTYTRKHSPTHFHVHGRGGAHGNSIQFVRPTHRSSRGTPHIPHTHHQHMARQGCAHIATKLRISISLRARNRKLTFLPRNTHTYKHIHPEKLRWFLI